MHSELGASFLAISVLYCVVLLASAVPGRFDCKSRPGAARCVYYKFAHSFNCFTFLQSLAACHGKAA